MTELSGGDPRYRDDRGGADPEVSRALAGYADGSLAEHEVLTALAAARLLVPVVAVPADRAGPQASAPTGHQPGQDEPAGGEPDQGGPGRGGPGEGGPGWGEPGQGEAGSEMAMPSIVGRDGRRALPAFTSLETLQRWRPAARPVPVPAASVWQTAAGQSEAVIIDIAGPVPLAIEGARLAALSAGRPVPRLHEDPDVHAAVTAAASGQPPGTRIRLGPPLADADLTLELTPADPTAAQLVPGSIAEAIVADVAARLGSRCRRGIAVVVRAPAASQAE